MRRIREREINRQIEKERNERDKEINRDCERRRENVEEG